MVVVDACIVYASYMARSIYLSVLWAGVQPTLDPYAEALMYMARSPVHNTAQNNSYSCLLSSRQSWSQVLSIGGEGLRSSFVNSSSVFVLIATSAN